MNYFFLYWLLNLIFRSPLAVIAVLAALYLIVDRGFVGLLPDFTRPLRRRRRMARLEQEVRLNPSNATGQVELAALYLDSGKAAKALPLLEQARERMEDSTRFHFLLGQSCYLLGRFDQARQELDLAVRLNPRVAYGEPYRYLLAILLRSASPDREAIAGLKEAILAHGSPEVFYRAGRTLLAHGDRDGAREMFREAVENYRAAPKGFRRVHRRWAALAWMFGRLG